MPQAFWPAIIGYALGSAQVLAIDWIRNRAQHRRQLRLLKADLHRLSGFTRHWGWKHGSLPPDDTTPNAPRITPSYQRLLQEIDFWLTDEHTQDNTQEALINISDGASVLERYASDVHVHLAAAKSAEEPTQKAKHLTRAVDTARIYDKEVDRWLIMVNGGLKDVERRLRASRTLPQIIRSLRPMPKGFNPPSLPPIKHPPSGL
jgi:hypothetical protein